MKPHLAVFALLLVIPATLCGQAQRPMTIGEVRTFMYQLQRIEEPAALRQLAESEYDLLVIEPTVTVRGQEDFDIRAAVARLRAGKPGRIVLAYLNPGQAESYRTYWKADWKAPTHTARGHPDFILQADPDGWDDNYNVAYWDPRWQAVFATDPQSEVRTAMTAGFDGVYLDWIGAYAEERIADEARRAGVDPARAMVDFLLLIRKTAREMNPNALVVQQNAVYLLDEDPRLTQAIDALGVEDTWFGGKANANWGSPAGGDIPNRCKGESSTAALLAQYAKYRAARKPVFTIDYCLKPANAARVYEEAARHNLIPLVTQVSLDHLTTTPPPALRAR